MTLQVSINFELTVDNQAIVCVRFAVLIPRMSSEAIFRDSNRQLVIEQIGIEEFSSMRVVREVIQ